MNLKNQNLEFVDISVDGFLRNTQWKGKHCKKNSILGAWSNWESVELAIVFVRSLLAVDINLLCTSILSIFLEISSWRANI